MIPPMSSRPHHLPDYRNPPLNEVVLGIQFAPARGYQQIRAGEVWNLYKAEFPLVEELPPIAPVFETFGITRPGAMMSFGLVTGTLLHGRFWFLSPQKTELIQFQQDRLLHNWRKIEDKNNEYPRFEKMIVNFEKEANQLQDYFNKLSPQNLICNQAEISYINHITLEQSEGRGKASDWFRFINFGSTDPDDMSFVIRRNLEGPSGALTARLICEVGTSFTALGARILVLTLTVRGAPEDTTAASALKLLKLGREVIVTEFAEITTELGRKNGGGSVDAVYHHKCARAASAHGIRRNVSSHSAFSSRRIIPTPREHLRSAIERLDGLCQLETGWDGYVAPPVSFSNAYFALSVLASACPPDGPAAQIVPGSDGDLQIEWHSDATDIELHIRGPNNVRAWRFTQGGDEDGEEINLTTDFRVVAGWLAELSEASIAARSAAA